LRRLILDTNVVVAGLLWDGPPRRLLDQAIAERVELYSSVILVEELTHTLAYEKFAQRIARYQTSVATLATQYAALATLVSPTQTPRVVADDPNDDHVLACAFAVAADLIVSGDRHLLDLGSYRDIPIVKAADAVRLIAQK
jgi:putative PIN family toxin of toxin-antitoxin system